MILIDAEAFAPGLLRRTPYEWAPLQDALRPEAAAALALSFPTSGFEDVLSTDSAKPYRMAVRRLRTRDGALDVAGLPEIWSHLVSELCGDSYRRSLERLASVPLAEARVELSLWRYGSRCFLAPHTDKSEKIVSHVFYLTPDWDASWGGRLLILRDSSAESVDQRIAPVMGTSVILRRSARSWHAVEEVHGETAPSRHSLQVVFYSPEHAK